MTRRFVTSLLIVLIAGAAFGAMEWYTRRQADVRYRQGALPFFAAIEQVAKDLRSDGAGNDTSLYRAQMMAADRADTLPFGDRKRACELDMHGALNLYAASSGKWCMALSECRPDLLDEAIADGAKGDALLDRARRELNSGE